MNRHLVAVEVRVESDANKRRQLYRKSLYENRPESLNSKPVQCRRAVQENVAVFYNFFENGVNFIACLLNQTIGVSYCVGHSSLYYFLNDKRAEKLKRHFFWQTAFVQIEIRADN